MIKLYVIDDQSMIYPNLKSASLLLLFVHFWSWTGPMFPFRILACVETAHDTWWAPKQAECVWVVSKTKWTMCLTQVYGFTLNISCSTPITTIIYNTTQELKSIQMISNAEGDRWSLRTWKNVVSDFLQDLKRFDLNIRLFDLSQLVF